MIRPLISAILAVTLATAIAIAAPADAQRRLRQPMQHRVEATALPAGARVIRDVAYGTGTAQRFDVYLPANARNAPLLFFVHGGGWAHGDKGHRALGNKRDFWLAKGYAVASTNYRMLPDAAPLAQAGDVASAIAYAQRKAPGWGVDPARVVLMGHSAGAHLVALLGSKPALLAQAGARRPLGVVALDSAAMDVTAIMQAPRHPDLYDRAFGTDPQYWNAASPTRQVGPDALPSLLVCSTQRMDACPQTQALARKAKSLGVPAEVLQQPLRHGEINQLLGTPSTYTSRVAAFIDGLVGPH